MMSLTNYRLDEIVARFGGHVLGDPSVQVSQIATLDSAQPHNIAFLANSKYRSQLASTRAGAVILGEADADATAQPRIVCANPYSYFAKLSAFFNPLPTKVPGVHA